GEQGPEPLRGYRPRGRPRRVAAAAAADTADTVAAGARGAAGPGTAGADASTRGQAVRRCHRRVHRELLLRFSAGRLPAAVSDTKTTSPACSASSAARAASAPVATAILSP